jgi:hypothetical protein
MSLFLLVVCEVVNLFEGQVIDKPGGKCKECPREKRKYIFIYMG